MDNQVLSRALSRETPALAERPAQTDSRGEFRSCVAPGKPSASGTEAPRESRLPPSELKAPQLRSFEPGPAAAGLGLGAGRAGGPEHPTQSRKDALRWRRSLVQIVKGARGVLPLPPESAGQDCALGGGGGSKFSIASGGKEPRPKRGQLTGSRRVPPLWKGASNLGSALLGL